MTGNPYLQGNFGPVEEELTATDLPVQGEIPTELCGRLLRIGPNPVAADPAIYHWFLGNGMVHGLRLRDGNADWYKARYVRDDAVTAHSGWPEVPGPRPAMDIGSGVANTNIIEHSGKTLAIVEAGNLPVELDDELETLGRCDLNGAVAQGFSAHPHRDPDTGELHTAVYSPAWSHIQYLSVDAAGHLKRRVNVPTPGKPMVHDCMFTQNYFILLDLPVTFDEQAAVAGMPFPYTWDPDYGARVGLLPRDGEAGDVSWHEVELCYVFHPVNAYEDDQGRVIMNVARHSRMFATDRHGPNEGPTRLDQWVIDPTKSRVQESCIDEHPQEFPRLDERRAGRRHRYAYTTQLAEGFNTSGLLKHDAVEGRRLTHQQGSHRHFMESVFVPKHKDAQEDEGWVMAYVYDDSKDSSDVVILNAQDFDGEPQAIISLPRRVPFGFHGNWLADH